MVKLASSYIISHNLRMTFYKLLTCVLKVMEKNIISEDPMNTITIIITITYFVISTKNC